MIEDDKFDSAILETIKEKKIEPKAKWTFLLKDYVVWALGLLSLLLGSVAVSVIIYMISNNDWDIYTELSGSLAEFILLTIPYFWIVFLLIFLFVINYNIKHTKKGYKFSLPLIFSASIFISVLLGALFFYAGLGRAIDDVLGENVSFYDTIINPRVRMWNNPKAGRLIGVIIEKVSDNEFYLHDMREERWLINTVNVERPLDAELDCGCPVKLIGKMGKDRYFTVDQIFVHNGPGRGMFMDYPEKHPSFNIEKHDIMISNDGVCTGHCLANPR